MDKKKLVIKEAPLQDGAQENALGPSLPETKERLVETEAVLQKTRSDDDQNNANQLRNKITAMDLDGQAHQKLQKAADQLKSLDEKELLEKLLAVAKKDVAEALHTAMKIDDRTVDALHDALIEGGYYKGL